MTYIVAQHMSPTHRSMMVELLSRETRLSVEEVVHNLLPKPNTVYIAPPNTDITVSKGRLRISKPGNVVGPKPSVDRFFISLAEDLEDRAIGIVLSGTGTDGAHGIRAIKAAGGISIAQEPQSAKYDSMPNAAIRSGGTDLVLPPSQIADQLGSIVTWPRVTLPEETDVVEPNTLRGIIRQIGAYTGMDFSSYKESTLTRQVMRRMAAMRIQDLDAYGKYIVEHPRELQELASSFLICVTSFFRDTDSFHALQRSIHELCKSKRLGDDIRIWVPGCATGEEVYSIAIMVAEELGENRDKYKVQIFATDINGEAVAFARAGLYPEASLGEVGEALINRYFTLQDGRYLIDKSLREMILFARQDIVQDPPFARLDLVSCRNMLIYFKPELQDRVMKIFHYSLRNNGLLFLGKSESVGRLGGLFAEKDRSHKIYLKRAVTTPIIGAYSRSRLAESNDLQVPKDTVTKPAASNVVLGHDRLFKLYAPDSLLVTIEGDILEIFGDCSRFLVIRSGKADFNIFNLIRNEFKPELRAFMHRANRTQLSAYSSAVEIVEPDRKWYRIAVHAMEEANGERQGMLLICFEAVLDKGTQLPGEISNDEVVKQRVLEMEHELNLNRENLQTVIEELETANEELQSLNEEAQAANEELQASNEELETANEELQSTNEELTTVNDELGTRSLELGETNRDLKNILDSLYKAMLVIDDNFRITRYNREALDFFDIPPGIQVSLATVNTTVELPDLLNCARHVFKTHQYKESEYARPDGHHFLIRFTPYAAREH